MAPVNKPHFQNDMGLQKIAVGSRSFMCIGAKPPFDHPHVYLNMGTEAELVCPYCSTHYVYDSSLGEGMANPPQAIWHVKAA